MANRIVSDLGAVARLARAAPAKLDQILALGEELVGIGRGVLQIIERLDRRAEEIMELGDRLEAQAGELIELGREMRELGHRIDRRGGEIVEGASQVVETGNELIAVMPTFERALEMATPLEGAIDRFGRLVDRLPGGRRPDARAAREHADVARAEADAAQDAVEDAAGDALEAEAATERDAE